MIRIDGVGIVLRKFFYFQFQSHLNFFNLCFGSKKKNFFAVAGKNLTVFEHQKHSHLIFPKIFQKNLAPAISRLCIIHIVFVAERIKYYLKENPTGIRVKFRSAIVRLTKLNILYIHFCKLFPKILGGPFKLPEILEKTQLAGHGSISLSPGRIRTRCSFNSNH